MSSATSIVNAFTVDVEDYFHVSAYGDTISRDDWTGLPSRVERNTDATLELLDEGGVKGTFFVLGWVAKRYPEVVRRIVDEGHELACHGYSHRLIYEQSPADFEDETRIAKALLEEASGREVVGYRGASFSITENSLWALEKLAKLGFKFDSSIFPVRHDRYGIPSAPRRPFILDFGANGSLTEFPMTTLELPGWRMPISGGGYFRIYPYALTRAALRHLNTKKGEACMFYMHPWEVDPDQPTFDAGWLSNFRHRTNLARCADRLRQLFTDFRFGTVSDVLATQKVSVMAVQDGQIIRASERREEAV